MTKLTTESGDRCVSVSDEAAANAPPTRRQKLKALAVSSCGFLAFYLLSAGPMAGLHNVFKVPGFQRAIEVVYAPVVFLVKRNVEPFSSIMKWYVDLFR
ncbi:hypothetical protein GC176_04205 [bacterium]|nr:hypothetical protein [bacterium]